MSKAGSAAHLLPRLHPRSCEPPPHRNARFQHFSRIWQKWPGNYLPDGESWFMVIHRVFLFHLKRVWHEPGYQDFWLPPSVIKRLTEISCLSLIHLITIMATTENLLYIEIKKYCWAERVALNKSGKKLQSYKRAALKEELMK